MDECVDGWLVIDSSTRTGSIDVNEGGGITINATSTGFGIRQWIEPRRTGAGKTFTLTINVSNVGGNSETLTVYLRSDTYTANYGYKRISTAGIYTIPCTVPESATGNMLVYISVEGTSSFSGECNYTIDWIKLEEGDTSTAPNGLVQNATQALYAGMAARTEDCNIKTYTAVSQLGLSYPCTTVEIMNALPLGSRIDVAVEAINLSSTTEQNITDAPYAFGTLSIIRAADGVNNPFNRYVVTFVRGLSNDHSVWLGEYVADASSQTITSVEWKEIINGDGTSTPLTAAQALYAQSIPTASETVIGGAKMYVDGDGYFCIDTQ